jgi:hypothetical protein
MGSIRVHVADGREIDAAFGDRLSNFPDRLDLRCGETKTLELVDARAADRVVVKRIECGEQARTYCGCAGGRKLLAANDGAQAWESRFAPSQAKGTRFSRNRFEPWICKQQLDKPRLQIVLGMKEMGHALSV